MMSSLKFGHWIALASMVAVVAGCGSTREGAWETSSETVVLDESGAAQEAQLLAAAQAAWLRRGEEAQALAAVETWKKVVARSRRVAPSTGRWIKRCRWSSTACSSAAIRRSSLLRKRR